MSNNPSLRIVLAHAKTGTFYEQHIFLIRLVGINRNLFSIFLNLTLLHGITEFSSKDLLKKLLFAKFQYDNAVSGNLIQLKYTRIEMIEYFSRKIRLLTQILINDRFDLIFCSNLNLKKNLLYTGVIKKNYKVAEIFWPKIQSIHYT